MGEIVDLESYRKKIQRKSPRAPGAGSRRTPDGAPDGAPGGDRARDESPGPRRNRREPRRGDSGKVAPGVNTKVEPSKPESD